MWQKVRLLLVRFERTSVFASAASFCQQQVQPQTRTLAFQQVHPGLEKFLCDLVDRSDWDVVQLQYGDGTLVKDSGDWGHGFWARTGPGCRPEEKAAGWPDSQRPYDHG